MWQFIYSWQIKFPSPLFCLFRIDQSDVSSIFWYNAWDPSFFHYQTLVQKWNTVGVLSRLCEEYTRYLRKRLNLNIFRFIYWDTLIYLFGGAAQSRSPSYWIKEKSNSRWPLWSFYYFYSHETKFHREGKRRRINWHRCNLTTFGCT